MLYGSHPQEVLANIQRRAELRRSGSCVADGRKLALVIEGGGMRSVYSGAGAVALAQLGLSDVFDEVYATSAGVMNASYFLTNQPQLGMSVYFENCTQRSFFNPWRFWKVLNVDYIIDEVAAVEKRLDTVSLASARSHLLVSACNRQTGEVVLIDTRTTQTPLLQVLKAAMAIPVFYNRAVEIDGHHYIDSGTLLPFPLSQVFDRGCTDVLVLLTRPADFREQPPTWGMQQVFNAVHSRGRKNLSRAFARRHEQSQLMRDLALGRQAPPAGVNVAAICPEDDDVVEATTTSFHITHSAAVRYGRKTLQLFGRTGDELQLT